MESLTGCPKDIALDIILGKKVLLVDEDKVTFNCVPFNPEIHGSVFERFHPETWAERKLLNIKETARCWKEGLRELERAIIRLDGKFNFTVKYDSLLQYFYDGSQDNLIDVENDDTVAHIKGCIIGVKNFIEECFKIVGVIEWMYNNFPGEVPEGFTCIPVEVRDLSNEVFELVMGDSVIERFIRKNKIADQMLTSYLKNEQDIKKVIDNGIKPVDILLNWTAGWLAPNGDYYALNGEIANMLHNQIADALVEARIIPISERKAGELYDIRENPDRWLEENGWVKIHGDWILYDGWNLSKMGKKPVSMTEIQKKRIYEYGQICCGGAFRLGFMQERISAARFQMTEMLMLKKYFEF